MSEASKEEWMRLMNELATLDRDEYRRVRAEAWAAITKEHARKNDEQRAEWQEKAS